MEDNVDYFEKDNDFFFFKSFQKGSSPCLACLAFPPRLHLRSSQYCYKSLKQRWPRDTGVLCSKAPCSINSTAAVLMTDMRAYLISED